VHRSRIGHFVHVRRRFSPVLAFGLICLLWHARTLGAADPAQLLAQAEQLADLYNWYDAHTLYQEAEKAFESAGDKRNALFARVSRLRGEMQTLALPELVETIDSILATDFAESDKRLQLRALIVRGDVNLEIDVPMAKDDWSAVLGLATELGDRKWQSRAQGELGMIAFLLGDAGTALSQVTQALMAARLTGDVGAEIRYYAAIATGLHLSADYEQAIRYFDLALSTAAKQPKTGFQYISIWGKAKALLSLGRIDEAERMIQDALVQADADDRRVKKVQMLVAAAEVATMRRQPDKALQNLLEARAIAEQGDFRRLLAAIYISLTELSLERNQIKDASQYVTTALKLAAQVGDEYLLPSQLLVFAKVRRAEGNLAQALEYLDRATDIVDGLIVNASTANRASLLVRAMSSIYAYHFELAAESHASADYAFRVLERARGRVLSDVISLGRVAQSAPLSVERRRVEQELSRLQRSLLTIESRASREAILHRIWEMEQRLAPTETSFSLSAPRRQRQLPLKEFQSGLAPAEGVVEYVFTDEALYALVISRSSALVTKLGKRERIEALVHAYQERLQNLGTRAELDGPAVTPHRALLAPLRGLSGKSKIVIVADGSLSGLPFDILMATEGPAAQTKPVVSFSPSATALFALRNRRAAVHPQMALLGVGDVPYDGLANRKPNPTRAAGVFDARTKPDLQPLPASRTEIETAVGIFGDGSVELLGKQATEGRLKKQPLDRFAIIHLAVHAFSDPKDPQRAALLLAPDESGDEDGFLQPREISQLPITAGLVVLSACNTGVGRSLGQEGIANLARAFLLAGASSVLTTLWSVGDTGSSALMTEFYQNLHAGKDVATALSLAKQALLHRFGPDILSTVAAFQVLGNGSVTIRSQNSSAKRSQP
jgi:CHAT domain-containing protein